jgi:hypothetical protein
MSYRLNSRASLRGTLCVALLVSGTLLALAGTLFAGSAQASTLPTLTLALTKSSITVGGTTQSGAVNVVSTVTGVKEASAILFQLKPGVTVAEVESALKNGAGKDPNEADKYGSIVFDAEVNPGQTSEAQTELAPGQYVALAGEGEGGPKFKDAFTVTAAASPATLPAPQATVRSIEFAFRGPTTLHDGELVLRKRRFPGAYGRSVPRQELERCQEDRQRPFDGQGKGAGKARGRGTVQLPGAGVARSLPAGDDHCQARLVCAGMLHGYPRWA